MIVDFDTATWNDPWFQELSRDARLLFIYLWTNVHKNSAGLYVITKRTMANETGLTTDEVTTLLAGLSPKVKYDPAAHVVWVVNHFKKQFLRTGKVSPQVVAGIEKALVTVPEGHHFIGEFLARYPNLNISYPFPIEKPSFETDTEGPIDPPIDPLLEGPIEGLIEGPGEGEGEGKGRGGVRGGDLSTAPAPEPTGAPADPMPPSGPAPPPPEPNGPAEAKALFADFWDAYPARNGKKLRKAEAFRRFCLVNRGERCALIQAARHYAASQQVRDGIGIRDAPNFIADGSGRPYWREWTEPERPPPKAGKKGGAPTDEEHRERKKRLMAAEKGEQARDGP